MLLCRVRVAMIFLPMIREFADVMTLAGATKDE
jgi:hypothetical protein